jgi:hypothetical protein
VIKKGFLSLIHRSTTSGHLAYLINEKQEVCTSDNSTGVWIEDKFYPSNPNKNGVIFIPYAETMKNVKIVMIHNGFA